MSSSSLFNLPILTEATQSKPSELVARFIPMNNLASATKYLNEFNTAVVNMETSMLMAVSEAESTKKENEAMARYFEEYGSEVKKLIQKINQQSSKFNINIGNFLDANDIDMDLVNFDTQGITYKKKCYDNLTNPELPKISIKKIFKKEYAILGKLLQDLKHAPLSDEARVTAITSVYDALIASMGKDWVDTCIQVITGDDNCNTNDFSSTMYGKFMCGEKMVEIDAGEISQASFILHSSTAVAAKQLTASFDELINELIEVSDEIEHIWFRNSENMIEIKTDEDGIADAKYALTDYSMNRVHQIIKAKIDQLNEVTNLYLIALSIKMDCIMKSAKQAREIIDIALSGNKMNTKSADATDGSDCDITVDGEDSDIPDDDLYTEDEETTDISEPDVQDDINADNQDNMNDYSNNENPTADIESEDELSGSTNESASILDEEAQFERDCYLFESSASRIQLLVEQLNAYNQVYDIVHELTHAKMKKVDAAKKVGKDPATVVQSTNTQQTDTQQSTNQQNTNTQPQVNNSHPANADKVKVNELAEKINGLIAALINKVRELVQKFQSVVVNKNNARITEIKNNQKTILSNGANGGGEAVEYNIKNLMELTMHIDYNRYKEQLGAQENAEQEYIKAAFPQLDMKDDVSLTQALTNLVVTEDKKPVTGETITNAVNYITKRFDEIVKQIQQNQNELTTKSRNVKNEAIRYMKEASTLEDTMFHYFTEFDAPQSSTDNNNGNGQEVVVQKDAKQVTADIKSQLMIMYKVNSTVLTTKMSLAQKAFNEYYSICKFFMSNTVVPKSQADQNQQQNNNQQQNDNQQNNNQQ